MSKRPWSDEEVEALRDALRSGMTVAQIALMLGRTYRSVEAMIGRERKYGAGTAEELIERRRMAKASAELARRVNALNAKIGATRAAE